MEDEDERKGSPGESGFWENSPIEQVRLTVPATDDPTVHVLTLRTWLLGIPLCIIQIVVFRFSSFRKQFIFIPSICIDLVTFQGGLLLATLLPKKLIRIPFTGCSFSLNPGLFNLKEHVALALMAGSATTASGFETVSISKIFYGRKVQPLPALLLILSTQLIAFGFAGIFSKLLVESPYMWYPSSMIDVSFYRALHEREKRPRGTISKHQFFFVVAVASFAYAIVPAYFLPSLSAVSIVCWIWKDSVIAQQIGSGMTGLGIGSFTLDWNTVTSFMGSPLGNPAFVLFNMLAGYILIVYVALPVSYWTNTWDARRFPLVSMDLFDADGQPYNVSRIVNLEVLTFDEDGYSAYSKIYFGAYLTCRYAFVLAFLTATLSYTALNHGSSVWKHFKNAYHHYQEEDVHARLMKQNYRPVPRWWYYSIILTMVGFAIVVCEVYGDQVQLRYWEVLLASGLVLIFLLPAGVLYATANKGPLIDTLLEIIIGYLQPGRPIANLTFQNFGGTAHSQALNITYYLKLSHYLKIPPKIAFGLQFFGVLLSCFVDFGMAWWMIYSIENICRPELLPEGSPWTCPSERNLYTYGVMSGLVGPRKLFFPDGMYSKVFIFLVIGFLAPFPVWLLSRKYPGNKWLRLINVPVILGMGQSMALVRPVMFWSYMLIGLVFNYVVYEKYRSWWGRYAYLLAAGLDTGVAFLAMLLSFSLQLHGIYGMNWWGLERGDGCPLAACPTAPGILVEGCPAGQL